MKTPRLCLIVLSGAVVAPAFTGCGGSSGSATERPRGVPVRVVKAERRDIEKTLVLTGTLRPHSQVQVVAEVSGRLLRVLRDEGSRVSEGEVLAQLDDTDYRLAKQRAEAALAVAEAGKAHAIIEKERADSLLKTGGITDKDHLAAQVNLQVAEASLAQVQAEAAIAAQQHARAQIKAPFAGRVARRMADPGSMLGPGTPLFTLVDDSVLEFRASVASEDYGKIKVGAPVDVTVDALPDYTAKGRVVRLTPLIDERSRSFEVVVEVRGGDGMVGGLFARATVRVGRAVDAVVVPPAALQRDGSTPSEAHAFVVVEQKAERRVVAIGVENAEAVQVTRGIEPGDAVVLDPPVALGSGTLVEIQNDRTGTNGTSK